MKIVHIQNVQFSFIVLKNKDASVTRSLKEQTNFIEDKERYPLLAGILFFSIFNIREA